MRTVFAGLARRACIIAIAGLATLGATSSPAAAQSDREQDSPTGWWWLLGATSAQVNTQINAGFRLFDIDRVPGGATFDAVLVQNSGVYQKSNATWYSGILGGALSTALSANNRRLIDIEPYDAGSEVGFSAVAISNTGDDGAGWGWLYNQTPGSITNWVANNPTPLRIIDLDKYTFNGTSYYSAVAINNTGAHASGWTFHFGKTTAEVSQILSQSNQRLVSLEVDAEPTIISPITFTIVTVTNDGTGWWWYPSLTSDQAADLTDLNGARIIDLERYEDAFGNTRFAVVLIDNSNTLSQQVRQVVFDGLSDTGKGGGYLKEVGGAVLANIGADHIFEPASMLKILYGAYTIDRCAAGTDNLANLVFVGDRCNNNECPDGVNCSAANETLSIALAEMLQQSDNNRTKVIHDRYTRAVLNNYADALGMSRTHINHDIGCGLPANQLTLRDSGLLYELIADNSLFNQTWEDTLYDHMNSGFGNGGGFSTEISNQAAGLELTTTELNQFKALAFVSSKGGSYGVPLGFAYTTGGYLRLPFKNGAGTITDREYVVQSFTNEEPVEANAANTNGVIWWTMARNRIRAALVTWANACDDINITNQPDPEHVVAGQTAHFSASANAVGAMTFQWRRNGVNLSNGAGPGGSTISGATTLSLNIANANPANEGSYTLRITNPCDTITSSSAPLTVGVCGTADFNNDGDVGTDIDIEAFFACLAGNCCATCFTADFNGDGDTGTDLDIEAFFRVLAGLPC